MNPEIIDMLACPSCKKAPLIINAFASTAMIEEGVLFCKHCSAWFPVIEGVPFILTELSLFKDIVKGFRERWKHLFNFQELNSRYSLSTMKEAQVLHYAQDSNHYDSDIPNSIFWRASDWNTFGRWIKEIPPNSRVLDLGCGTGRCTIPLAEKVKKVIGVDLSFEMIRQAIRKSKYLPERCRPEFIVADAERLPFRPESFDAVIGFGILHHVEHPQDVLSQVSRVVTNKGLFFALENNDSKFRWIFDMLMSINRLWNEQGGTVPLMRKDDILSWAHKAGLEISVSTSTFLPPHIFNIMSLRLAKIILYYTDMILSKIPVLGDHGGQLVIKGIKIE